MIQEILQREIEKLSTAVDSKTQVDDTTSDSTSSTYSASKIEEKIAATPVVPHLMQSDTTDQAIANVNNAQVVTFNTDVHHQSITRTSSSRFTVTVAGSYLVIISALAASTLPSKRFEIWLSKNGSYVDASNTIYDFKAANSLTVISVSFIEHFEVGDYFEFWMWGNDTGVRLDATVAGTSPTRPSCPSIIMTANLLSKD